MLSPWPRRRQSCKRWPPDNSSASRRPGCALLVAGAALAALVAVGKLLREVAFAAPSPTGSPRGQRPNAGPLAAAPPELDIDLLQQTAEAYTDSLKTNPIPTKFVTAAVLATAGDAVSQGSEKDTPYDWLRGLSFALFGGIYTGTFQHWWFGVMSTFVPTAAPDDFAMRFSTAALQTVLCQFGTIPLIYLPIFFLLTGALRGLSLEQSLDRARSLWLPLWQRNINFWIPVQMVQFLFVEPEWQVPFLCVAGLIWNVILSSIAGPLQASQDQSPEQDDMEAIAELERMSEVQTLIGQQMPRVEESCSVREKERVP